MANYQLNHTGAQIDQAIDLVNEHETSKANVAGFYAGMSVGYAEGIISNRQIENPEAACPPVTFGATGGNAEIQNGRFKFEKLLGNTIVDNGTLKHSKSAKMISRMRNQWDGTYTGGYIDANGQPAASNDFNKTGYIRIISGETYCIAGTTEGTIRFCWYDENQDFISGQATSSNTGTAPANAKYLRSYFAKSITPDPSTAICIYINYDTPNLPYVAFEKDEIVLPNVELKSGINGGRIVQDELYQQGGGLRKFADFEIASNSFTRNTNYTNVTYAVFSMPSDYRKNYNSVVMVDGYGYGIRNQLGTFDSADLVGKVLTNAGTGLVWIGFAAGTTLEEMQEALVGKEFSYELATPTEITSSENAGWDELVKVDNYGTIQFVDSVDDEVEVQQGYFVRYTVNLVEFLDTMYVHTGGDGNAIPLIPDPPTSDGTYHLKVVVADGVATYSWEVES